MRLVALLNFYNEPPADLARCVTSLGRAGVDHLVAVDGPYAAFPHKIVASPPGQHAAIRAAAWATGMGLTLHVPLYAWRGNEVEKRTFMHGLALAVSVYDYSWHLVIDADEIVDQCDQGELALLWEEAGRSFSVATVTTREQGGTEAPRRRLFRAKPLRLVDTHCTYVALDGDVLSDNGSREEVSSLRLGGFVMEHRRGARGPERLDAKAEYYSKLPEGGSILCECGRPATSRTRANFRLISGELISDSLDTCQFCLPAKRAAATSALLGLGINPAKVSL